MECTKIQRSKPSFSGEFGAVFPLKIKATPWAYENILLVLGLRQSPFRALQDSTVSGIPQQPTGTVRRGFSLMENHPFSLLNTPQSKPCFRTGSALFRIGGWDRKLSVSLVAHDWTTTVLLLKMTGLRPLNDNWVKKWKTHCQSWRCPLGPKYIYIYTVYCILYVLYYISFIINYISYFIYIILYISYIYIHIILYIIYHHLSFFILHIIYYI